MKLVLEFDMDRTEFNTAEKLATKTLVEALGASPSFLTIDRGPLRMHVKVTSTVAQGSVQECLLKVSERMRAPFLEHSVTHLKGSTDYTLTIGEE